VYNAIIEPLSDNGARDIEEAWMGDYKQNYHHRKGLIFTLPEFRDFEERLESSKFDNMSLESTARRYRFLVPFIIKAELSPGLAFAEAIFTWIQFLTFLSVLIDGNRTVPMVVGGASLLLLLTISNFWYGMWRYPSIWNSLVPVGYKGCTLDENFAEIRDICSYYCNGHDLTNSQMLAFLITLPFTIIFHVNSFLVTAVYYVLEISRNEEKESKLPAPVTTSIFISNLLVTLLWFLGGRTGAILATATAFFNQKMYNSLLFQRNFRDFCFSLLFGDFLMIQRKRPVVTTADKGSAYSAKAHIYDLAEEGINEVEKFNSETNIGKTDLDTKTKSVDTPLPVNDRSLPPLLGASTSSSLNSLIEDGPEEKALSLYVEPSNNNISSAVENITSVQSNNDLSQAADNNNEYIPQIIDVESASQKSEEELEHIVTVIPTSNDIGRNTEETPQTIRKKSLSLSPQKCIVTKMSVSDNLERNTEEIPHAPRSDRKKSFSLSPKIRYGASMSLCEYPGKNIEDKPYSPRLSRKKFFGLSPKNCDDSSMPLCKDLKKCKYGKPNSPRPGRKLFGHSPNSRTSTAIPFCRDNEKHAEEIPYSPRSGKKKFFNLSRQSFLQKNDDPSEITNIEEEKSDAEMSNELLNPSDIYLDIENHPGTIAWRNVVSESIQRFKIKSYTLRKHNWVMNRMYGKSFFTKEDGKPRRKLKRKEIKERSKSFHDKQLDFRFQISGILDDLKDLKKNHNSKNSSDHTRNSLVNNPLEINEKLDTLLHDFSTCDKEYKRHKNDEIALNHNTISTTDAASSAKDSHVDSSKESTVSTLTTSIISSVMKPEEARSTPWITGHAVELKDMNKKEDIDSSASFRDTINRLLEYTSWLDNLNPLKETTGTSQKELKENEDEIEIKKSSSKKDYVEDFTQKLLYSDAAKLIEKVDCGDVEDSKRINMEAYWHSLVDEKKIVKPILDKNKKKYEERGDPPRTIFLEGNTGSFIKNVNSCSRERRKLYPIWKNALQFKKSKKAREYRSQMKETPVQVKEKKRAVTSFWKKKKDPFKVIVQEHITYSTNSYKSTRLEHLNELDQDDRNEAAESPRGNDDSRQEINKIRQYTTIHDDTLNIKDKKHFRDWEGDKDPEKATTSKQSKRNNDMPWNIEYGPLEDITGVCAQQTGTETDDQDFLSDVMLVGTHRVFHD